jgi:hypothetical protein
MLSKHLRVDSPVTNLLFCGIMIGAIVCAASLLNLSLAVNALAENPLAQVLPVAPAQGTATNTENLDNLIKNFKPGEQPVVVPPITFVDVNAGRFGKLEIDLEDGQFQDAAVDKMHLIAKNLDVKEGVLKSLDIAINGGHIDDFTFDHLDIATRGDLNFDAGVFINHKILQFNTPAEAEVTATVSQDSLNRFLNSPKTLQKLSVSAGRKVASIASAIGLTNGNIGLNVSQADLALKRGNKVLVGFQSNVGVGQMGLPINGEIEATLGLKDGWLEVSDPHVTTQGQELPADLSGLLVKKIGGISQSTQRSQDIRFSFTDLKVSAGKQIQLKGTAQISRLRFGHSAG